MAYYLTKASFLTFYPHISYQINKCSLKTRFVVLQVKLVFSLISRICALRVRGKQKVSGFFYVKFIYAETIIDYHKVPTFSDRQVWANNVDQNQTAPEQGLHGPPRDNTNKMTLCPAKTQSDQNLHFALNG